VAKKYGNHGFAGALNLTFEGSAGQSFGAFNVGGMNVKLVGEANDYVGKSMTGGELVVVPPSNSPINSEEAVIMGNTCLYGATGGRLLADGKAGERFAVRNSRAETVVLGAGDHCCEYMTGGTVVVLGNVGRNVGAGMTGGLGYFLDADDSFLAKVNGEIVKTQRIASKAGEQQLKGLIQALVEKTGSKKGQVSVTRWGSWRVIACQTKETNEHRDAMGGEGDDGVVDGQAEEGGTQPRLNGDPALRPGPQSLHARHGPTHTATPGSLQRGVQGFQACSQRPAGMPHPWAAIS
jgi:glutamate synthase (ferredoxin)